MASSKSVAQLRKPPLRPGYGKNGKQITVFANHYAIQFQNDNSIVHYDMQIEPESKIKEVLRAVFQGLQDIHGYLFDGVTVAFDSRCNLYANKRLHEVTTEAKSYKVDQIRDNGSVKVYTVTLKEVLLIQLADLNRALKGEADVPYQALQAADVVLRWTLTNKFNMVYRSFYPTPLKDDFRSLGRGHESWRGYYQSARPSQTGLSLNIDTSHTAFYEALRVDDYLCTYFGSEKTKMNESERRKFATELKNVQVVATHGHKRKYRITDISSRKPGEIQFENDGQRVSVTAYLRSAYNINLQYPNLPCLKLNNKEIYLPMEVCEIRPGQYYKKKINESETSNMVKFAAIPADQRRNKINEYVNRTANYSTDKVARGFNLRVDNNMKKVAGRVLPPVNVIYRDKRTMTPRDGSWNLQNIQFFTTKKVQCWGCLWFRDRLTIGQVEKFIYGLKTATEECGIQGISERNLIDKPRSIANASKDFTTAVRDWMHKSSGKLDFVLCIIPGNIPDIYGSIKTIADLEYQLPTQCIQSKNVDRANKQFLANVALKINAKLGGTNNVVHQSPILNKPTIIFGADVTHPGIGDKESPSIAAVVGTADIELSKYFHAIRIQEHRKEIIADLQNVVRDMLKSFYQKLHRKPERIIFYRDGVSEGQFASVIREELTAIEKACASLEQGYRPAITFVVVQKRHHTRFFPARKEDSVGKARNVPPGLVVDRSICHPSEFDFYLCSHFGIQGTSRPTHYHVLVDESEFTPDVLQQFTYQLCHLYCRCTRSVSIPAPVYYSHHLAFRARSYLAQRHADGEKALNAKINTALTKNPNAAVFFA